jgi:prepilin-type N-terminal cleavage/methylation domain-containing protein
MKKQTSSAAFTLIELLVVISIIAILAGIALPVFSQVQEKGAQTKALSNAKQIGLACKLYAGDNEGQYPNKDANGVAIPAGSESNLYLKTLIPDYVPSEKIFFVAKSQWNLRGGIVQPPDEVITAETDKLGPGENHWAYVTNLTETSNPSFPLLADGFSTTPGTYSAVESEVGGVWKGKRAIVIRADQSGSIEKVKSTDFKVYGKTGTATDTDIFATAPGWLSTTQVPVNPTPGT